MKKNLLPFFISLFIFNTAFAQTPLDTLSLKSIFHEPYIPGARPGFAAFSPDGKHVYFNWSEDGTSDTELYRVDLKGKNLEKAPEDFNRFYTLTPSGKQLIFQERGDIKIADHDFENERTIVASKAFDFSPRFNADGSQLAYAANGDIWITGLKESLIKQVTNKDEEEPGYSIIDWAGNEMLILSQNNSSNYKEYYFPEYAGQYVRTGESRRGIPTRVISLANIETGRIDRLFEKEGWTSAGVNANGSFAYTDWVDADMKHREITMYDLHNDTSYVVFEDSTKGWIYGRNAGFSPNGETFMFQSEMDGWNHIYTLNLDGSGLKKHTSGSYDIPYAEWLDDKTMVIATSENDPGDIQLYKLELNSGEKTALTTAEGHRRSFRMSEDNRYVVYSKTYFNEPAELYLVDIKKPGKEIRLTDSTPEGFEEMGWQKEDYIKVISRDGETTLSASILKPDVIDEENGNPVVVFVHGAGSLQNVFKGWSFSYWREYMFNQFLTKQGYYVIEVDYRHSTGYGRKFREDVTNWMGKYETEDIEDGLAYLADNYASVDTSNVGIYGGSYGGFMALYAVSVSPDKFDAAAALRSVTNWKNYYYTNPWYTRPRLGTPESDSANYARSSPITYADSLEQPVLILHGLIDNNVGFQDAAQYIERLIQSGNEDFEMMMYPTERHSFRDEDAWYDEYRRIFEFFERELK
jgi:dipeptidyl aminopeptidase/acylaminoacyl peptidase